MRRSLFAPVTAVAPIVLLTGLLAGCGGSDEKASDSPSGSTDSASPADTASADSDTSADGGDTESCIVGDWTVDMAAFQDVFTAAAAAAGNDPSSGVTNIAVDGSIDYSIKDDGTWTTANDYSLTMSMTIADAPTVYTTTASGPASGTWTYADGVMTWNQGDASSLKTTTAVTVNGEPQDLGDAASTDAPLDLTGSSNISCTGDVITITSDETGAEDVALTLNRK